MTAQEQFSSLESAATDHGDVPSAGPPCQFGASLSARERKGEKASGFCEARGSERRLMGCTISVEALQELEEKVDHLQVSADASSGTDIHLFSFSPAAAR